MKTVWKYELEIADALMIEMPDGAELLTVQVQGGQPCLWALVDPDAKRRRRKLRIAGTGHPINADQLKYVGSFQIHHGALVFHVFDAGYSVV